MNRKTLTIAKLAIIVFATLICGLLVYYISSFAVGSQLATQSNNMMLSRWQDRFLRLTMAAGGLSGVCSLICFILTRWVFKINTPFDTGKRTIWALLAAVSLFGSILIPRFYSVALGIKVNVVVIAVFVFFFTVLGYWLVSIFTTSRAFKYTPVGARLFSRK